MSGKALDPADVVLVVGKRGNGKSHEVKRMLQAEISAGRRVVALDYHDEYSVHGRRTEHVDLGPCRQRVELHQLLERPELLDGEQYSLAVQVRKRPVDAAEDFAALVNLVLDTEGLTFAADELGAFEEHCRDEIDYVATQSRHAGVPLILAAQRMIQIPKTARTQASVVKSFKQSNPEDLAAIAKLTGSEEFAARVSHLPRRKHLEWRDDAPPSAASRGNEAKEQ